MPTVNSILARKGTVVHSVSVEASVLDAAQIMNQQGIGGVVVLEGADMVGIFTERDILRRVVAEQKDPATTPVRDVMTSPVSVICPWSMARASAAS